MKVFLLGGGTMGLDIAQVFRLAGHEVTVREIDRGLCDKAEARLASGIAKRLERGKLTREQAAELQGIRFTTELAEAAGADFCLEAIVENAAVKRQVFSELSGICAPSAIFASNTSSISVTEIFSGVGDPTRCIGMHFFNPATKMELVELIRSIHTSDETFKAVWDVAV